jgi:hypothetical protein
MINKLAHHKQLYENENDKMKIDRWNATVFEPLASNF